MADVKKYVSLDKLTKYDAKIKGVISAGDAKALTDAKAYADGLAVNYEAAGAAATAKSEAEAAAKAYTDAEVAKANAAAAEAKTQADKGVTDAAAAKEAADAAQADVDALELLVGTLPEGATATDIVGYVQEKTSGIATEGAMTELGNRITQAEKDIDAIEADYLKAADKTELEGKINAKADQTALDGVSAVANAAVKQSVYDTKVAALEAEDARIVGLVEAEAERAAGVEVGLNERLEEVEAFFKLAEGEQLDTALDTLKEIQDYVTGEGAAADQMVEDIAANRKAIEDHIATDHDFAAADSALKSELEGKINAKAAQADLETLEGRVETAEGAIEDNAGAIAALEAKFGEGEGSVADMIADAVAAEAALRESGDAAAEASAAGALAAAQAADGKAVAADEKAQAAQDDVDALEGVVAGKAAQADLEAAVGRIGTLEGDMTQAKSDIDAVEALAAANDAAIKALQTASATHATQTALQAEIDRAKAAEEANAAAIAAFVEVSEEEVNALFA